MGTKDLSIKELQAELERQGRVPAPPPRRQFVEELLTRIQVSADDELEIIDPEPVLLADRRAVARLRVLGALAVAAALLVVVGLYSQLRGSSEGSRVIMAARDGQEVQVGPNGTIDYRDGPLEAKCREHTSFEANGKRVECDEGESITLTVEAGRVIDVDGDKLATLPSVGEVESALAPETSATPAPSGGTEQRSTTPDQGATTASTSTTRANPGPSSSAGPSGGTPGDATTDLPSATVPAATTPPPVRFQLSAVPAEGSVAINWPAWSGDPTQFGRYVVLRTVSIKDSGRDPDTPTVGTTAEAARIDKIDQSSFVQPLDGTNGVPPDTPAVAYRVAVVNPTGELVGLSDTIIVRLKWKSFGMRGDVDPAPTTTTTEAQERAQDR